MKIKSLKVGLLETNCYILIKNKECLVIDPGNDIEEIIKEIDNNKLVGILVTHHHFDHVGSLSQLANKYKVSVYDYDKLKEGINEIENFKFEVIYTPGHTSDSISYYFEEDEVMFTGDFLFKSTVGRCDLPTGDFNLMLVSLNKLKKYNENIKILPGHGNKTTLKEEFENNEYFKY